MREFHILNLGAGVQSTAVYLMANELAIWQAQEIDFAIFADTGEEPEDVYTHLAWLRSVGNIPIMIRTKGKLGDHLKAGVNSTGQRFASIPAFTRGAETGVLRRQCSKEYKIEVIERAIRREILGLNPKQRIPKDVIVHQYYGISLDESGRARRIEENSQDKKWLKVHFPLLKLNMTRTDCLNWLSDKVPHQVPKSACVFCPYHNDAEWIRIKANAADWQRAVEIDEALRVPGNVVNRRTDQKLFLHRSCKPLVQITFDPKARTAREFQTNLAFNQECMGVCGV